MPERGKRKRKGQDWIDACRPPKCDKAFVYFIQVRRGRLFGFKIGRTDRCPYHRLAALRSMMPKTDKYELLGAIPTHDSRKAEAEVHRAFAAAQRGFELFVPDPELIQFVRENARPHICSDWCFARSEAGRRDVVNAEAEMDRFHDHIYRNPILLPLSRMRRDQKVKKVSERTRSKAQP